MKKHAVRRKREVVSSSVCAWCAAPSAHPERSRRRVSHGICPPCLARLRGGFVHSGARFWVWDAEPRRAADWASELAAVERSSGAAKAAPVERELAHPRAQSVRVDA